MRKFALTLGLLGFLLNPGFACSPADDQGFTYGEEDMLATVQGAWRVTIDKGQGPRSFTLQIDQSETALARLETTGGSLIRSAHACGSRTFVKGAAACLDISTMPLSIAFTEGDDAYKDFAYSGIFSVASLHFTQGQLSLNFGEDWIYATLPPGGTSATISSSSISGVITMERLSI